MPGLLSSVFDSGDADGSAPAGSDFPVTGEGHEGAGSESHSSEVAGNGGSHLDPSVAVHLETGGTDHGLDGSEGSWSNTTDVAVDTDVAATWGVVMGMDQDDMSAG